MERAGGRIGGREVSLGDVRTWDAKIEHDFAAGRLDALAGEAFEDYRAGRCGPVRHQSEVLGVLLATSDNVRRLANEAYRLLPQDPKCPSSHLKRTGRYWSARIGLEYRALAVEGEGVIVRFWIGSPADYDRLIAGR